MTKLAHILMLLLLLAGASRAAGQGVSPFAEALYWHASQEPSSVWSSNVTADSFSPANVDFGWDTGLRTGFAFQTEECDWDTKLYWTHFATSAHAASDPGDLVIPEFFSAFLSGDSFLFTAGAIDWDLNYNTFDFELGREFAITPCTVIRPWTGLKAAVIDQSIHGTWSDPLLLLAATETVDHQYWGLGLNFGLDGRWRLPGRQNIEAVGSFSGALMSGVWNVKDTYQRISPPFPTPNSYQSFVTSLNDSSLTTMMLKYFVGLEWTYEGPTSVKVHLGYELQWWANQQRLPTFQQLPMHGDLTIQGGSCGLSVSF